jgi:hypothetical protein
LVAERRRDRAEEREEEEAGVGVGGREVEDTEDSELLIADSSTCEDKGGGAG